MIGLELPSEMSQRAVKTKLSAIFRGWPWGRSASDWAVGKPGPCGAQSWATVRGGQRVRTGACHLAVATDRWLTDR
jgi:hypothetical protein